MRKVPRFGLSSAKTQLEPIRRMLSSCAYSVHKHEQILVYAPVCVCARFVVARYLLRKRGRGPLYQVWSCRAHPLVSLPFFPLPPFPALSSLVFSGKCRALAASPVPRPLLHVGSPPPRRHTPPLGVGQATSRKVEQGEARAEVEAAKDSVSLNLSLKFLSVDCLAGQQGS